MKRIAVWSGPRNISTAMMRSFENRPDACVVDEPFYGCYLKETGLPHPMAEEIIQSMDCEREVVIQSLTEEKVDCDVFFQKHMTHHMPEGFDLSWSQSFEHVFLIREPARVIASYLNKMPQVNEDDIGIVRQRKLFDEVAELTGKTPLVVDSIAVLKDPRRILQALCEALEIPFFEEMLQWPKGRRESDGVWASHWYQSVEASTGFQPFHDKPIKLTDDSLVLSQAMEHHYMVMRKHSFQ